MKKLFILLFILLSLTSVLLIIVSKNSGEWACINGEWIKRGIVLKEKPSEECAKVVSPTEFPQNSRIKVYFGNTKNQSEGITCISETSVERQIEFTLTPSKSAIDELLKGPTSEEISEGIYSNIPDGVTLRKISLKEGKAYVDLDRTLEKNSGGSCKVLFIRSQITNTLMQFPEIKEVIISVEGRTEDMLQP